MIVYAINVVCLGLSLVVAFKNDALPITHVTTKRVVASEVTHRVKPSVQQVAGGFHNLYRYPGTLSTSIRSSGMRGKDWQSTTRLFAIKGPVRYSSDQWIECLISLPKSNVIKLIGKSLLFMAAWTALLTWLYKRSLIVCKIPPTVHTILGSALSLLLVFRTNSSYDRFWEGRKAWGSVVFLSRELGKNTLLWTPQKYHQRISRLIVAFAVCLKQHLQGDRINEEIEL